jgi:hypothetical protein
MKRSGRWLIVLSVAAFFVGCGSPQEPEGGVSSTNAKGASQVAAANTVPPNEVVAMFADSIRRGDREATIKLITPLARQEIQRQNMAIDPPGSPEASYRIGEVRYLDDDRDAAYVESLWIEPSENGQPPIETEVVWAVQLEAEGWRISGLAIDMGKDQPPTLIDFENLEAAMGEEATANNQGTVAGTTPANATTANTAPAATVAAPPMTAPTAFSAPPNMSLPPANNGSPATANSGFTIPEIASPPPQQGNMQLR